jgi:hypothetical protein
MTNSHITKRALENANKFAFLVGAYPEKTVPEIIGLFQLPPIDINTAIWAAVELQFVTELDQREFVPGQDGEDAVKSAHYLHSDLYKKPETWDFGPNEADLEDAMIYAFEKLNAEEKDMEENYLSNWTRGYMAHDVLVATKKLLEDNVLHEYELEDGDNAYIFYTLKKNADKLWGSKQFKTNPLTGEDQRTPEQVAEDEKNAKATEK